MKLTFDGAHIHEIMDQMRQLLAEYKMSASKPAPKPQEDAEAVAVPVAPPPVLRQPVEKPVEKRVRTEKQLANDERMRVAALAKIAARKAAKADIGAGIVPPIRPTPEAAVSVAARARAQAEPFADPADAVKLRQKTIEDLQAAYANGHQQEVFELLSRFGNGAKSFRELPPEAFMPIREAIDKGALT